MKLGKPFAATALSLSLSLTFSLTFTWAAAAPTGEAAGRDPMLPPPDARPAAAPGAAPGSAALPQARHLMVVDGVRYVIEGGRRRGVGDLLGGARIERIEDSGIVVRQGRQLQRLPLYVGVVKRPVTEPAAAVNIAPVPARPARSARAADAAPRTAQALAACDARPTCMQRPGEPQ